ncbi:uncharacterized protein TNCV_2600041 [Trichonephila clavipes]|nr:uncharacterized protein TNCV_2600041 [Trichonephila clavipes]
MSFRQAFSYGSRDKGAPSECAACAGMSDEETVGCSRAFLTMWWSFQRVVCGERPELGLRINDISRVHWLQNLLTTQ